MFFEMKILYECALNQIRFVCEITNKLQDFMS